jgi:2-pyrone-4,6-dicarboxylate lactonase
MTAGPAPHPDHGLLPAFAAPAGACDTHFHVFGPADRYPHVTIDLRYRPPRAPLADYLSVARRLGLARFVLVQPSAYGLDNSCLLAALSELDPAVRRAIVHLDETAAKDTELASWHGLGVRGVRINVSPVREPEAGLADVLQRQIARTAQICRELGWHEDLLLPGWLLSELMPALRDLPVAFTVAHMGLFPASAGPAQPGFKDLLALAADGSGRCFVKLTGMYRLSQAPGYADVKPFAEALIATAPGQLIWGSDYPHLSFHDKVGTVELYNMLADWVPDAAMRQRILADNPARLFEFSP